MKTRKNIYFKVVALAAIAIAFAMPAKAQLSDNGYANIDWQFNAPLSNNFAEENGSHRCLSRRRIFFPECGSG